MQILHKYCLMSFSTMSLVSTAPVNAQSLASQYTTGFRYDGAGRVVGEIHPDPDGIGPLRYWAKRITIDTRGLTVKIENGELSTWQDQTVAPENWAGFTTFQQTSFLYDGMGRKVQEATSARGVTQAISQYSYDADGRLQCSAVRMNPATFGSLPASACTLGAAGTQGPDRITFQSYDQYDRVLQIVRGYGTELQQNYVTYTRTAWGAPLTVTDANGNIASIAYDQFGRQTRWNFPSPTAVGQVNSNDYEAYAYDANSNRTSLRKRDGSVLNYTYDALNRVKTKTLLELCDFTPNLQCRLTGLSKRPVFYAYDLQNHQTEARFDSLAGEGVSNTFDGFGRQTSSSLWMDNTTRSTRYCYDPNGNRTLVAFPDSAVGSCPTTANGTPVGWSNYVSYNYDGLDRPSTITRMGSDSGQIASYSYNPDGTRASFNGGVNTSYGYDGIGRLTSLANTPASNASYANSYSFGFNPASQITSLTKSNNLFVFNGLYNVNRPYAVNGLNQYTTAGGSSFTYDDNGNLTSDGATSFLYDIENRLVGTGGAKNAQLRYDPLGRLYEIVAPNSTIRFAYDGDALVAEYDGAGNLLRRYVHGADLKSDDPIAWYEGAAYSGASERILRPDWQGSIALATDNAGSNVYALNTYDEYGIPGANNAGRFQYTGQAWEPELGLYYYKARFYSPTLGRFLQTDPIGYKDQVNLYAYVNNDPMDKVDYSGESWDDIVKAVKNFFTPPPITPPGPPASPPQGMPHGPFTPKPDNKPGSFQGPQQPKGQGPRSQAQWVPPEGQGGPPGSKGYWKGKGPGQEGASGPWQRYDQSGKPITPAEAHPNPMPESAPGGTPAGAAGRGAAAAGGAEAGGVLGTIIRWSPLGLLFLLSGDTPQHQ